MSGPHVRERTSFGGDVLRLVSGTSIAQLISVSVAPILTRLYAPEAFGVATMFASIAGIIAVVACMRYELAIVLPESDEQAANLLAVSICSSVLVAAATALLVWLTGAQIARALQVPSLAAYLWLAPLAVLSQGFFAALNYWNTRTKRFTRLSVARVGSQLSSSSMSIGAGVAGHATGGAMIGANVAGQGVATLILGGQILRDNGRYLVARTSLAGMLAGLKRYKKFPLISSWSALLNIASWQVPALLLGAFFSPAVAGLYALGFRILQMPMSLIGSAISQVFIQRAARAKTEGTLAPLVDGLFQRLTLVGMFPTLMLALIGRDLYVVAFGENWSEAGIYTQILSAWALVWFVSSPMSALFSVLERQEFGLKLNLFLFLSRVASLAAGAYLGSARLALCLFAATGMLLYGYQIVALMSAAGVSRARAYASVMNAACYCMPFVAFIGVLQVLGVPPVPLLLAVSLCFALYVAVVLRRHADLFQRRREAPSKP